ncbi:MAG: oligosaccharide flippase family protein [Thermodesulfobacteriota bacterium]
MATTDGRNKTSFIRDAGYLLGTFVLTTAIALVPTYLVLRLLSVDDYGRLKLLLLIVSLSFMSELGVGKALRRSYPIMLARGEEAKIARSVGAGYVFAMLSGLALCGGLAAVHVLGGFSGLSMNLVLFLALCANILCEKSYRYLQIIMVSEARFRRVSGLRLAGALLGLLVVPGVYLGGVDGYLIATALSEAIMVALGWRLVAGRLRPQWHWPELRPLLQKGLGLFWVNVQNKVMNRLETVLVSIFLSLSDLAIYSVAFQAMDLAGKLYNSISELVMQRAARTRGQTGDDDRAYLESYLGSNAIVLFFTCFAVLPAIYYLTQAFITIALPKYLSSLPVLLVLSVAFAFQRCGNVFTMFLAVRGDMRLLNLLSFAGLGLNLLLDLWLMWRWGLLGLAWGCLIAYACELGLVIIVVYRLGYGSWRPGLWLSARLALVGGYCLLLLHGLDRVHGFLIPATAGTWFFAAQVTALNLALCLVYLGSLLLAFAVMFRDFRFLDSMHDWFRSLADLVGENLGRSPKPAKTAGSGDGNAVKAGSEAASAESDPAPEPSGPLVLLAVSQGFEARYLLRTAILDTLLAKGCQVAILTPNPDEEYFRREFGERGCRLLPLAVADYERYRDQGLFQALLRQVRALTLNTEAKLRFLDDKNPLRKEASSWRAKALGALAQALSDLLRRTRRGRGWLVGLENWLYTPAIDAKLFEDLKPAALVCTSPGYWLHDTYLLRQARKYGVPTVAVMLSWDNPSSKGYPGARPDLVLTWTEAMRQELATMADIPADRLRAVGVASFDIYARPEQLRPRAEFLAGLGLDPALPVVTFVTKAPGAYANQDIVRLLIQAVQGGELGRTVQLIVRLHPIYVRNYYQSDRFNQQLAHEIKELVAPHPWAAVSLPIISSQRLYMDMPREEMLTLASLVNASDVLVSTISTMNLEGALLDKPLVNIAFDGDQRGDGHTRHRPLAYEYEMPHIQRFLSWQGSAVARSPAELLVMIRSYLDDPALHAQGRRRIVEMECGPNRGRAGEVIAQHVYEAALSATAAPKGRLTAVPERAKAED